MTSVSLRKSRKRSKKLGSLKSPESQKTLVQILIAFKKLNSGLEDSDIRLLPQSKTTVRLESFCADATKAEPQSGEIFRWTKGHPDVQLAQEIIGLFNESPDRDQTQTQKLIWNLANNTYFEDYPEKSKTLLLKVAPNARLILPSRIRSEIVNQVIRAKVKDAVDIVKGQYYEIEEFKNHIESLQSSEKLPLGFSASAIPSTDALAATTRSDGYGSQVITLFNPSNHDSNLKIADYYLKPVRNDVQPIILSSVLPNNGEIEKILSNSALKMLGYLGSQYPTLNSTEKNLVKRRPIDAAIVFYNAMIAGQTAGHAYPHDGLNSRPDAFRHFVWAALLTRDIGKSAAREFLNAHEVTPAEPADERSMDDFNNGRGIEAAINLLKTHRFSDDEIFGLAKKQIAEGKLRIINHGRSK